jgi:hypothetical protein
MLAPHAGLGLAELSLGPLFTLILGVQFFTALFLAGVLRDYDEIHEAYDRSPPSACESHLSDRINAWLASSRLVYSIICGALFIGANGLFIMVPLELYKAAGTLTDLDAKTGGIHKHLDTMTLFVSGLPILVVGAMMFKGAKALQRWYTITFFPSMLFTFTWPMATMYFAHQGGVAGGIFFLLVTGLVFTGIILLKTRHAEKQLTLIPQVARVLRPLRRFVVPAAAATALVLWNDLVLATTVRHLAGKQEAATMSTVFPYLLAGGLIPVRLIILLVPPVKPLHLVSSCVSLFLLFATLDAQLPELAAKIIIR